MAIGTRIVERLNALGWKRSDLMARVPGLTPQSLSNLIRRDSKRSEHDQEIADALGVTVLWLVYGQDAPYPPATHKIVPLLQEPPPRTTLLEELHRLAQSLDERGQIELIGQARLLATLHPAGAKANTAA